uniref:Immunoglobulin V-set domain-containing protein n=1 Tax=Stegastes partitus TaxID=144197 RepID=A0A3B5B1T9_9TELE
MFRFRSSSEVTICRKRASTDIRASCRHSAYIQKLNIVINSIITADQLGHQDQLYRNRTSLFKEQISRGNASLQLTGVKVQDEGRYQCFISTFRRKQDSLINLKVEDMRKIQKTIKLFVFFMFRAFCISSISTCV